MIMIRPDCHWFCLEDGACGYWGDDCEDHLHCNTDPELEEDYD